MARKLTKLIKEFRFEEKNRSKIVLTSETRLNPKTDVLELVDGNSTGVARTWVTNPKNAKQWLSFEAIVEHDFDFGGPPRPQLSSLSFRLGDGTDEFWWDGGAWVVNTTSWNTEAEVANNIAAFPIASQSLQVVAQLATTRTTPRVQAFKVLYASDVSFQEDIIYRSLVRSLRENIRPISDYGIDPDSPTPVTTLDLENDFPLEAPYNIAGIDSVYNYDDDQDRLTDLFAGGSYDANTKIITLGTPLPANKRALVRFTWEPEVAVTTSQDYNEVAKLPSIVLTDINLVNVAERGEDDSVVNRDSGAATKIGGPLQGDIEVVLHGLTDKGVDHHRLSDELKKYFRNNPLLNSQGVDEEYSLWLIDEYDMQNAQSSSGGPDLHTGRALFRIRDVKFYVRDSVDSFGVKRFLATGTEDFTIAE